MLSSVLSSVSRVFVFSVNLCVSQQPILGNPLQGQEPGDQTFKYSLGHLCFLCIEQETFAGGNLGLSVQSALVTSHLIRGKLYLFSGSAEI